MGNKETLRKKAIETTARLEQEDKIRSWHSGYYHRYFEGWTEIPELKPNGHGVHIRRVYTGEYYRADMSQTHRRGHKALCVLLVLLSLLLYVRASVMGLASNTVWYVVFPQVLALCGYLFLGWFLISKLSAPVLLTIREYREASKNLKLAGGLQSAVLALAAVNTLLHFALSGGDGGEILAAVFYLLAGSAAFGVCWLEQRVKYLRVPNENAALDGFRIE